MVDVACGKRVSREGGKPITLYDAVAGRVGYEGFLTEPQPSKYRNTTSTSTTAVPPDEVLFRRKGAPLRFEEDDVYAADRHLRPHQRLPESDMLKALHAYTADLYSSSTASIRHGRVECQTMDETALLAIGILLEEAAVESLGRTGDLALVEQSDDHVDHHDGGEVYWSEGRWHRSVLDRVQGGQGVKRRRSRSHVTRPRISMRHRSGEA